MKHIICVAQSKWIKNSLFMINCINCVTSDVDECKEKEDDCPPGTNCKNTIGSYTCECPLGQITKIVGGKTTCSGRMSYIARIIYTLLHFKIV